MTTTQQNMDIEGIRMASYQLDRLGEPKLAKELRDLYFRQTGKRVPR